MQLAPAVTPPHLPASRMGFDLPTMRGAELAPGVSQEVEEHFLPKWMRQRGFDPDPAPLDNSRRTA